VANPFGPPTAPVFGNFVRAWTTAAFGRTMLNSLLVTAASIVGLVALGSMASFPLARRPSGLHRAIYIGFVSLIMIPFQMAMIPLYRLVQGLGWINTFRAVVLTEIACALPFTVFLYTGFMKSVPKEIEESGIVDGCDNFTIFAALLFPMLKPATATVVILNTLGVWNDFLMPLLFLQEREKRTIQIALFIFQGQYNTNWNLIFAAVFIAACPLLLLFIVMQKDFIKGITAGAVKG
jgi:raffinose/stachyose/melibiose transport system permease protein